MTQRQRAFDDAHEVGTPPGMTPQDVDSRFELGRWFGKEIWPADRATLLDKAEELEAPEAVLVQLRTLPDRRFTNTQEVMVTLGLGVEESRP